MPWWIWLLLVLFMLGMIIAGVMYVIVHALRGMRAISGTVSRAGDAIEAMGRPDDRQAAQFRPIFTEPLSMAAERYADAHADVIRRRNRKRDRHVRIWADWSTFNRS